MSEQRVAIVGSINLDAVLRVPRLPAPGETVIADELSHVLGGKGANQAIAAARVVTTDLVAQVGSDAAAATLVAKLQAAGVGTTHVRETDGPTGRAHVAVDSTGENSIIVVAGSNHHLQPSRVTDALDEIEPSVVAIQCEVDASVVRAVHDWAAARSVRLIINASPVPNYLDELVPIGDPLIVNRGEAEQITGLIGADVVELAAALRARAVSVVITDGARGATIARDSETHAIAARHVSAVDTTGAGDAFAGAVAGGLAQGMNLSDAVGVGIAEAARVVSLDRRARGN